MRDFIIFTYLKGFEVLDISLLKIGPQRHTLMFKFFEFHFWIFHLVDSCGLKQCFNSCKLTLNFFCLIGLRSSCYIMEAIKLECVICKKNIQQVKVCAFSEKV